MDTRAIKGDKVPDMQNAIEEYTLRVEDGLNAIKGFEITPDSGFYGNEQVKIVDGYIDETCTEINAIVRYFDEFKEALAQVGEAYAAEEGKVNPGEVEAHQEASDDMITVNRMD